MATETQNTSLREIYKRKKEEFLHKIQSTPKSISNASLDDYIISHTLGTGTFASVVLAKPKNEIDKNYAIKIMRKHRLIECNQAENVINEKKLLFALDYPFLVKIEKCFKDNSNIYIVIEYVKGGEMFTHLRKKSRYSEEIARFYACQIVLAFEYLHYLKIIYRNLVPENILFGSDGYIKLADFGLAKMVDQTYTKSLCGTPEYLAPEIIAGKGYNREVDWWALGVLIYEMITGVPPFAHQDNIKTYEEIIKNNPKIPSSFSDSLSKTVTGFLQTHVSKRLGSKYDAFEVKTSEWFKGIDWKGVYEKRVSPPFLPEDEFDRSDYIRPNIDNVEKFRDEFESF